MNYHDEIMRIHCDPESDYDYTGEKKLTFKEGHRDARHAAAEIALGAENEIERLRIENEALREALGVLLNLHDEEVYVKEPWDRAMKYARAVHDKEDKYGDERAGA